MSRAISATPLLLALAVALPPMSAFAVDEPAQRPLKPPSPGDVDSLPPEAYVVEIRVVESSSAHGIPIGRIGSGVLRGTGTTSVSGLTGTISLALNESPDGIDTLQNNFLWNVDGESDDFTLLANPVVGTTPNRPAQITVGTSKRLTYLEKIGDDTYRRQTTRLTDLGISVAVNLTELSGEEEGEVELSPVKVSVTAIDGREKVDGLDFPVGKPIITTRSLETSTTMKLGQIQRLEIHSAASGKRAWILLRIQRAEDYEAANETRPGTLPSTRPSK